MYPNTAGRISRRWGALIAEYTGRKLTSAQADKKWRSRYLFDLNKKWKAEGRRLEIPAISL